MGTCCIDKSSSAELSETINSMFRWYRNAQACYVYHSDFTDPLDDNQWVSVNPARQRANREHEPLEENWKVQFQRSRWFTRGWTLQELIAPRSVVFFSKDWHRLGDKASLQNEIQKTTGIDGAALQGRSLSLYSVEERISWAARRQTTCLEDAAYLLLGIFDVNMPLLYGDGDRAFGRLAEEIAKAAKGYTFLHPQKRPPGLEPRGLLHKLAPYLVKEAIVNDNATHRTEVNQDLNPPITPLSGDGTGSFLPYQDRKSLSDDDSN